MKTLIELVQPKPQAKVVAFFSFGEALYGGPYYDTQILENLHKPQCLLVLRMGTSQLVTFKPYLENLQKMLSNQYYVVFEAVPRKKSGFQRINIQTELSNSELEAPDNVWVPAAGE